MRLLLVMATWLVAPIAAQPPLAAVRIAGNQRLDAEAIVRASGLRPGQTVSPAELEAAAQQLLDTGLFSSIRFEEQPLADTQPPRLDVTFTVAEERADMPVRLDIPGRGEPELWRELRAAEPLLGPMMPHNDRAAALYRGALERILEAGGRAQKVAAVESADLTTGRIETWLVPANPPLVSEVRFTDNGATASQAARIVAKLAIGQPYSSHEFRQLLLLNARPLYEERGCLKVEFGEPELTFGLGTVAVVVPVAAGAQWTLGTVEIVGDGVPSAEMYRAGAFAEGRTANWKQLLESVAAAQKVLLADGYFSPVSKPVRRFRDDGRTVDVRIEVTRGKQYRFGALDAGGLGESAGRVRQQWRLNGGDPFDKPYTEAVLDALLRANLRARMRYRVRPDGTTLDVVYSLVP